MNAPLITLALLGLMLPCAAQSIKLDALKHGREVPGNVRFAFNRLVAGDLSGEEDEIEELARAPGMNAVLMELLDVAYHGSYDYPLMRAIFAVLLLRTDLRKEDQEWLRAELKEIWNQRDSTKSVTMKEMAIKLLAKHPGDANEDIMLLYLRESVGGEVLGSAHVALLGLEAIGTTRALVDLQSFLRKLPSGADYEEKRRSDVTKLIARITDKQLQGVQSLTPSSHTSTLPAIPSSKAATKSPDLPIAPSSIEPSHSAPWSIIVVLIVAATGLLGLLRKKRK